ncbi:MAG: alpha/beta hydrolase family protein, partial [Verrucomicrobiota bacterium]
WHVAYVRQVNRFGSPGSMKVWEALYDELHGARDLSPKPALLGISRGGLYVNAWTRLHPDRVSVLYLDNGVCDIRSWPGGFQLERKGKGSPNDWKLYKAEFGFADDAAALERSVRPEAGFAAAIKAGVTLISCHGTADQVVPHEDNAAKVVAFWKQAGGRVVLFPKEGGDHHPHGLPDPKPLIEAIAANAGCACVGDTWATPRSVTRTSAPDVSSTRRSSASTRASPTPPPCAASPPSADWSRT